MPIVHDYSYKCPVLAAMPNLFYETPVRETDLEKLKANAAASNKRLVEIKQAFEEAEQAYKASHAAALENREEGNAIALKASREADKVIEAYNDVLNVTISAYTNRDPIQLLSSKYTLLSTALERILAIVSLDETLVRCCMKDNGLC